MKDELREQKRQKKQNKLLDRLKTKIGKDLCACGPSNYLLCEGICRKIHMDKHGNVKCPELYTINMGVFKKPKREKHQRSKGGNIKEKNSKNGRLQ